MSDLKREEGSGAVVSGCLADSVRFDTSLSMLIRNYYHFPLSFFLSFFLSFQKSCPDIACLGKAGVSSRICILQER